MPVVGDFTAAQSKPAAKAQRISPLANGARKCTAYLYFSQVQSKLIFDELARLEKLRAERASVLGQSSPGSKSAVASGQAASSVATASPELLKVYNSQIDKVETELLPRRKLLVATNYLFQKCVLGLRSMPMLGRNQKVARKSGEIVNH